MSRKTVYEVKKETPLEEINQRIKHFERSLRVLKRLYFIRFLYKGKCVEKASEMVGITKATGYSWLRLWNNKGYEGLIPNFGGGRPPKLKTREKKELRQLLEKRDDWITSEVQELIKKQFKVDYSYWQVNRILKSFEMKHSKPYPNDYRRPVNAKVILKKD